MLKDEEEKDMLLHDAIEFAAKAHEGQFRKGTEIPYIVHPFETAMILLSESCTLEVVIAGLLHDTVEDCGVTLEEIETRFGEEVAELVCSCSEDKSKSWKARKSHTIKWLESETDEDKLLLACADKLSNIRSIRKDYNALGEDVWMRFNKGREEQQWYYNGLLDAFKPLHDYDMFWEFSNHYSYIFVKFYLDVVENVIFQTDGKTSYMYTRRRKDWLPCDFMTESLLGGAFKQVSKDEANALEDQWRDEPLDYWVLPISFLMEQEKTRAIFMKHAYFLKGALEQCHASLESLSENMGGGIPPEAFSGIKKDLETLMELEGKAYWGGEGGGRLCLS